MTRNSFATLLSLIDEKRLRQATAGSKGKLIASESDKGRVVNAAGFRRLQQKAQVFPLDTNASVRTRLTHSIEVAQIGRYLAQRVIAELGATSEPYADVAALVNVVESACLLHDIGNPPFGHFGEAAISDWFKKNEPKETTDLCAFDGNPQGLRLISHLSGADSYGMNLTCSLLLSTIKYPWRLSGKPESERKIGIFDLEWSAYDKACAALGWPPGKHFPFARLMEAADDIAYSMSDLEDGLEKNIIRIEDLKSQFDPKDFRSSSVSEIVIFKANITNRAVDAAAKLFARQLDAILVGDGGRLLAKQSEMGKLLGRVKQFARDVIYSDPAAERVELAGYRVICGLLDHFQPLLLLSDDQFRSLLEKQSLKDHALETRLARRLPKRYRDKYLAGDSGSERERRLHLIVDFIAGMTDDFALETYQVLEGIRLR